MTDFSRLNVNEVLIKDSLDEYQKSMNFFWDELTKLNINIFIIEKIREFPFDIFCSPQNTTFFSMVIWNFFENSVLLITKLVTDSGQDLHTLRHFKNWVLQQIKPEYSLEYQKKLKENKFDLGVESLLKKAKDLRDFLFAHFNRDKLENIPNLNLSELTILKDKISLLFDILSFEAEYEMLPLAYSNNVIRPKGIEYRSDIEEILESIAKNSNLINMPESLPDVWKYTKSSYGKEGINIINKYRKKFNLPEA